MAREEDLCVVAVTNVILHITMSDKLHVVEYKMTGRKEDCKAADGEGRTVPTLFG